MERLQISFALLRRNRVRSLSVPLLHIYISAGLAVVLLALAGFLGQYLVNRHTDYGRLNRLVAENYELKAKLAVHVAAVDTFRQFLARTEEMDNRLRCATDLYLIPADVRMMGIGGTARPAVDPMLDNMLRRAEFQERSLVEIDSAFKKQEHRLRHLPSIWPVRGWVTSEFGMRRDPFTGGRRMHNGIDIVAPYGSAMVAPADGRVVFAGWKSGWGRCVEIDHGNGIRSFFAHCRTLGVDAGKDVKRGDKIATVGSSGRSTGTHLHYGVKRSGAWTNPRNYIISPL